MTMTSTFETTQPWIIYRYGYMHDRWWPPHNSTRVLGYAKIGMECAVCGISVIARIRIPRFGDPSRARSGPRHERREQFLAEHAHPDRGAPMSWARPLLNPAMHPRGIDLDALAMRLDADLNESAD